MEYFDQQEKPVKEKEKSVYLLHLDTPRIILVASVIIGIIAGAFLIGMNFMKPGNRDSLKLTDTADRRAVPGSSERDQNRNDLPELPRDSLSSDKPGDVVDAVKPGTAKENETIDLITGDKMKDGSAPVKKDGAKVVKSQVTDKPVKSRQVKTAVRSDEKPKAVKKDKKKSGVVEVSVPAGDAQKTSGSYFAVQIASYDNGSRAEQEAETLKRMSLAAYVDKSSVNGKTYYRVRIGPHASKDTALESLRSIQENTRYADSYLVRETR